jgi:type VII secretion-associated serine protease mycosin
MRHVGVVGRIVASAVVGLAALLFVAPPASADSIRVGQWQLEALDVARAHRISQGRGVTVAVLDTGVDAGHRDLLGNVLPGMDFTGGQGNGWVDADGHGTGMAGLIAAHGHGPQRGDGALGIAPEARILPIRVGRTDHPNLAGSLSSAIDYAVRHGAAVISMSIRGFSRDDAARAVDDALRGNVVLVAGSGNRPKDVVVPYPARYPGVVAVGATRRDGSLASFTTTGPEMAITAPGEGIVSTGSDGGYRLTDGTSDATAIVAGAAALIRSRFPKLSASEVVHRLTATATDKGRPGRDPQYGYGALNLVKALTADVPVGQPSATSDPPSAAAPAPSTAIAAPVHYKTRTNWFAVVAVIALLAAAFVAVAVWVLLRRNKGTRAGSSVGGGR